MKSRIDTYVHQREQMLFWVNNYLDRLTDEQLKQTLVEDRNTGVWILGHLIISDDDLAEYIGKGQRLYPEYVPFFDSASVPLPITEYPPIDELKTAWAKVSEHNLQIIRSMTDDELEHPHAKVKDVEEDFFKTKENILIHWNFHQVYHAGQLGLLHAATKK